MPIKWACVVALGVIALGIGTYAYLDYIEPSAEYTVVLATIIALTIISILNIIKPSETWEAIFILILSLIPPTWTVAYYYHPNLSKIPHNAIEWVIIYTILVVIIITTTHYTKQHNKGSKGSDGRHEGEPN
jgi:heme/copper-type cytochrome/quinol oxidase subunit 4